jgi:L-asparaginase
MKTASPYQLLLSYKRGDLAELEIFGAIAWVSGTRLLHQVGENPSLYLRSLSKPLQIKNFAALLDRQLSWEQKALALSSHSGEERHLALLRSMLPREEHGLLQTPSCKPVFRVVSSEFPASSWCHPCSGNHAAVLTLCRLCEWDRTSYKEHRHPYQQQSLYFLAQKAAPWGGIAAVEEDGCGFPTPAMSIGAMAHLFADLAARRQEDWIWEAMQRFPELVGGDNRLDTAIMQDCKGAVVAKEGADGLLGLAIVHDDYPEGLGIVIKLSHGMDSRSMERLACTILARLGYKMRPAAPLYQQRAEVAPLVLPERYC